MTPHQQAPPAVDVGVTLGELAGQRVVVAAVATPGITAQVQLPPESAVQYAVAILAAAAAAGADLRTMAEQLQGLDPGTMAEQLQGLDPGTIQPATLDELRLLLGEQQP